MSHTQVYNVSSLEFTPLFNYGSNMAAIGIGAQPTIRLNVRWCVNKLNKKRIRFDFTMYRHANELLTLCQSNRAQTMRTMTRSIRLPRVISKFKWGIVPGRGKIKILASAPRIMCPVYIRPEILMKSVNYNQNWWNLEEIVDTFFSWHPSSVCAYFGHINSITTIFHSFHICG